MLAHRVAALWVDATNVVVHLAGGRPPTDDSIAQQLTALGATYDSSLSMWCAPARCVELITAALDRAGYVWAADHREVPRTWAERVVAELPPDVAISVLPALHRGLHDEGAVDHAALLAHAWYVGYGHTIGTSATHDAPDSA